MRVMTLLFILFLSFTVSPAPAAADTPSATGKPRVRIVVETPSQKVTPSPTASPEPVPTETPDISQGSAEADTEPVILLIPTPAPPKTETTASMQDNYLVYDNPGSGSGDDMITLSFLGDCSIGDSLNARNNISSMTQSILQNGDEWLFSTVSDTLSRDDFTLANLEVVLTDRTSPLYPLKVFNMIGYPAFSRVLRLGGIDGLNTVNNHCIDFRYGGYEDTLANLESEGLMHFGSLNPARKTNRYIDLGRIEIKGIRIGLIGFTYPTNDNLKLIEEDIRTLRSEGCQIVIVSLHWGREEHQTPNASQFPYAQKILDAGADVIWGHHPHVLQPVYFHDGKPVFFSTGNFVFGTIKNLDPASGIFQLTWNLGEDGSVTLDHFTMIPTQIRHGRQEYRPLVLKEKNDRKKCLQHVIGKTDRNGFIRLPDGFADTGVVYINSDGSLRLTEVP